MTAPARPRRGRKGRAIAQALDDGMPGPHPYGGRPVGILRGGRRDGWCYFVDELEARAGMDPAIAGGPFGYEATGRFEPHPVHGEACMCAVWLSTTGAGR